MNTDKSSNVASALISFTRPFYRYILSLVSNVSASALIPGSLRVVIWRVNGNVIGKNALIGSDILLNGNNMVIGDLFVCGRGCFIDASGEITIGHGVHIGPRSVILSMTHGITTSIYRRRRGDNIATQTVIGNGSWICANVTILPGVNIGEGCVVSAGSVVRQDCQPNGLYGGNPAHRIKDLPTESYTPYRPIQ